MNNIEKKLRKRGMQKLDKFAHNPYHVAKPSFFSRIPLWTKIVVPAVAMTAVTFVASISLIQHFGSSNTPAYSNAKSGYSNAAVSSQNKAPESGNSQSVAESTVPGSGQEGYKGDTSTPEGYPNGINFQGAQYGFLAQGGKGEQSAGGWVIVSEDKIGAALGDIEISENKSISVFEIKDYSKKAFVAMKFSDDSRYYATVNSYNTYTSIGDFLEQIPFETCGKNINGRVTVNKDTAPEARYKNADDATVFSYLFSDTTPVNDVEGYYTSIATPGYGSISLEYSLTTFDVPSISLTVYSRGYLLIRVGSARLETEINTFNIGVDKYNSVLSYVETLSKIN